MKLSFRDKISILLILVSIVVLSITFAVKCSRSAMVDFDDPAAQVPVKEPEYLFGICIDSLNVASQIIEPGQTLSTLMDKLGIGQAQVNRIAEQMKDKCGIRFVRAGNNYHVMSTNDTLQRIQYFIYEDSRTKFAVVDLTGSTPQVQPGEKEVTFVRQMKEVSIQSSISKDAFDAGMSQATAGAVADVYQWSIDFYALQKNDKFKVIYDDAFIDGEKHNQYTPTIWGAWFDHNGKRYYAIRHTYTDEKGNKVTGYYNEEGKTLKSAFLKAPLNFTRISSRFSYSRLHPVLRIRRPHLGVDYAAPKGTPVRAIGSGTVTMRQYAGGGGNTIKIRHDVTGYMSGYLHLSGYAKNLRVGKHIEQGEIIGYVGSTGTSTGPHLDFRLWKNGKPIDPLKITDVKGKDIEGKYRAGFEQTKARILMELNGDRPIADTVAVDSMRTDSIVKQ